MNKKNGNYSLASYEYNSVLHKLKLSSWRDSDSIIKNKSIPDV